MNGRPVFRFAPSPNGLLHLGHALSALLNADMAARAGGRQFLRIENIDRERSQAPLETVLREDLRWIGFEWEGQVRRQSEHMADYRRLLDRLREDGLVYPAFMSRGAIRAHAEAHPLWPRDPDGAPLYPGLDRALGEAERARRMSEGEPFAWRLDMGEASRRVAGPLGWREWSGKAMESLRTVPADPALWGDVVLARRDVPTSYHLSVVADDAAQRVSHVVRGLDLFHATAVHRLLQELLGLPEPTYFHHRLVLSPDGSKLSKSEGAASLRALREAGASPDDVRQMIGLEPATVPDGRCRP